MKKTIGAGLVFMLAVMMACKGKDDVLGSYNGGKITRGDLYDYIEINHFNKESLLKSKKMQKSKLETLFLERMAIQEAKKQGVDKTDEFKFISDMATESQIISIVFKKEIEEKIKFKEPAVKLSQIVIKVKNYEIKDNKRVNLEKEALKQEVEKAVGRARGIIDMLNKGENFAEIAKKHSDDFSKKNGGLIGFVIADMIQPELTKAAFALKEGEYTREPVALENAVYILKVDDKTDLTEDNLSKIIENKMQVTRVKNRLYRKAADDYIKNLMKAPDVAVNLDKVSSSNKNEVLFKVGDLVYTVGQMNQRIEFFKTRFGHGRQNMPKITNVQKKQLAENILKLELFTRVAKQKGFDKDPEYLKKVQQKKDTLLAREFMRKIGMDKITISEAEMKKEYDANKDKRYYTMKRQGNKNERVIEPYAKVKDRIKRVLENKVQMEEMKKWKDRMLRENNFKIDEKQLEGE